MGFLRRLIQADTPHPPWPPPGPITEWPPMGGRFVADFTGRLFTGYFSMATLGVAGESHYQEALDVLGGGRTPGGPRNPDRTWFAVPEPDNPKDPAAVRVFLMDNRGRWALVGYFSRQDVRTYRPGIDRLAGRGQLLSGSATLTGGWDRGPSDRGSYGVSLDVLSPAALALILDAADGIAPAASAPAGERPYATVTCPYCSSDLDPLPKASKKKCPSCGQTIHIVIDPVDGIRLLLTEADAKIAKALIEADRIKATNASMAVDARDELRGYIADGWAAVEVQVELYDGEPCAACRALAGIKFPIREAPKIPPAGCACPSGCDCSYDPTD